MHRRTLAPLNINAVPGDEVIQKQSSNLIPTTILPDYLRSIFPYENFNSVQSECFHLAFETNENLVISAPTGTGKTVIAELAIAHILQEMCINNDQQDLLYQDSSLTNELKPPLIVYVSPLKSLCQERALSWIQKFKKIPELSNLDIIELTSDTQGAFPRKVKKPTIVCTTPEKLDLATRSMKGSKEELIYSSKPRPIRRKNYKNCESFDQLSLVIFDEVHNMSDSRGAVLEAVMSRILFISEQKSFACTNLNDQKSIQSYEYDKKIRVLALSATIRNYKDFKQWLKVKHDTIFDDKYRSTKIDTRIFGYSTSSSSRSRINDWMFESSLTAKVTPIIRQYSKNKPVLIFCCTRKSCEKTASKLATDFCLSQQDQIKNQKEDNIILSNIRDKTLLLTLKSRVGIHTAGLCPSDRTTVEQLFMKNSIRILCTTSTLAQGVNLPAYLVIIKGTKHFTDGSLEEYDSTQILQMQGRAGRPQFEKEGVCIIMTEKDNVKKYEKMIDQSDPIESSLLNNLEEHLNAEIALGFINDEEDVLRWLMSTFLYIRMEKNPFHYKLTDASNVSKFLHKLAVKHLKELEKHHFIKYENSSEETEEDQGKKRIFPEDVGSLCSQYGLLIGTMILYNESNPPKTLKSVLSLLCKSFEFSNDVIVRQDEKQKLRLMSVHPKLRFLSDANDIDIYNTDDDFENDKKSSIFGNNNYTAESKVFVLIDTCLSLGKIEDWSLSQEFTRIKRTSERLLACMLQLMASQNKRSFLGAVNCAILLKCIKRQMWENDSERLAQQVKGIGEVFAKKISSGFKSLQNSSERKSQSQRNSLTMTMNDLRKMTSYQIDKMTNHRTGWGIQIVDEIQKIPQYSITISKKQSTKSNECDEILINLTNLSQFDPISPYHKVDIFVGIQERDLLVDYFHIKKVAGHTNKTFSVYLSNEPINPNELSVYVIDSEYVGIDLFQNINFDEEGPTNQATLDEFEEIPSFDTPKSSEICERSPYFKNNAKSSKKENVKDKKAKPLSDTYLTQYFQLDKKPIEVNKQRIQAICPEFFEQYYDEDKSKASNDYEIVWPKPKKFISLLQTTQEQKDSDNDEKEVVVWSLNKKVPNNDNDNTKISTTREEAPKFDDFKLDDDFWENLEFDEESD